MRNGQGRESAWGGGRLRRLLVWAPRGRREQLREVAERHGSGETLTLSAETDAGPVDLLLIHAPNRNAGALLGELGEIDGVHISVFPHGVLVLGPPPEEAPQQVREVTLLSPLEIFLGGLQSIGSWRGFLGYAACGGLVAWIGLFTNTVYLLTAAMLISPFAGPAMNAAIATARGDHRLLARSLGRYLAALAVAIATAATMTLLFGQRTATRQMVDTSTISTAAVVLPLVAGLAGALSLSQSERSSLVSGAATGILVAASLAPPAGMVGMAAVIGEWAMVRAGLFLLGLQILGINLSGALAFRLVGLGPEGSRYARGRGPVQKASLLATLLALAGFLAWQFAGSPELQHATLAQRAETAAQEVVDGSGDARLVQANASFTRPNIPGPDTLFVTAHVQRTSTSPPGREVEEELARRIQRELLRRMPDVSPVVSVTALDPP